MRLAQHDFRMTITQLLIDIALILGVLLVAALAIVPVWLEHEAESAEALPAPTPIRPSRHHPVTTARHAA